MIDKKRWCCAAIVALATIGCSDDEGTSSVGPSGPTVGPTTGAGGGGGSGGTSGAGGGTGGNVPDDECVPTTETPIELYPDASFMTVGDLAPVGGRWIASGGAGYLLFDRDGSNADADVTMFGNEFNRVGAEGSLAGIVGGDTGFVRFVRVDENGTGAGPTATLANVDPDAVTAAPHANGTIVVWGVNGGLVGRPVNTFGAIDGNAFDVATSVYLGPVTIRSTEAVASDGIMVAWTGASNGAESTFARRVNTVGPAGDIETIYDSSIAHEITGLVTIAGGYVALINGLAQDNATRLISLDTNGAPQGEPLVISPSAFAVDLVTNGSTIAVAATRGMGPEIRIFDANLEPVGPWVCLDTEYNTAVPIGVASDGDGWAAIYETTAGATRLVRVGASGTGGP